VLPWMVKCGLLTKLVAHAHTHAHTHTHTHTHPHACMHTHTQHTHWACMYKTPPYFHAVQWFLKQEIAMYLCICHCDLYALIGLTVTFQL